MVGAGKRALNESAILQTPPTPKRAKLEQEARGGKIKPWRVGGERGKVDHPTWIRVASRLSGLLGAACKEVAIMTSAILPVPPVASVASPPAGYHESPKRPSVPVPSQSQSQPQSQPPQEEAESPAATRAVVESDSGDAPKASACQYLRMQCRDDSVVACLVASPLAGDFVVQRSTSSVVQQAGAPEYEITVPVFLNAQVFEPGFQPVLAQGVAALALAPSEGEADNDLATVHEQVQDTLQEIQRHIKTAQEELWGDF